jgi:cation transport ATPase
MSIGEIIDQTLKGMTSILANPLFSILLVVFSLTLAFGRWWFNHYNWTRAHQYAKTAILALVVGLPIFLIVGHPEADNAAAWRMVSLFILMVFFAICGYYIAAIYMALYREHSSYYFKNYLAKWLRTFADRLETSAKLSGPSPREDTKTSTMEVIKEVFVENKDNLVMFL